MQPGDSNYHLFADLPIHLYPKNSDRFKAGHEPQAEFLEACYVMLKDAVPVGRFAFYENPDLLYEAQSAACIGSYECIDEEEVSSELLGRAIALARAKNYRFLIGPMEGSTWNSYRFSLNNDAPNFFMEPYHHLYYNQQFQAAGFKVVASYFSSLVQDIPSSETRLQNLKLRFEGLGARFRPMNPQRFEQDLEAIARLSLDGFAENFLYTPISVEDFVKRYSKLKDFLDPSLVYLAEDEAGALQAFIFGLKDYFDPKGESLIIKSMARKRNTPFKGVGRYLALKLMMEAKNQAYQKVIHALMIEENASRQISKKTNGKPYKAYQLYGLPL